MTSGDRDQGTIFGLSFTDNHGRTVALDQFTGQPLLLVNTASKCGFTPQYDGLQALHEQFGPRGLVVIGFPCDQFAHQEPGDDTAIEEFCRVNHGVTFSLSTKIEVNGKGTHPVFRFLKSRTRGLISSRIMWNFTKFLVAGDGLTVTRSAPNVEPEKLTETIRTMVD
jgi:glutathione peroxidase